MSPDIADTVRHALDERADALDVRTPPWQELEAGFGRVRRTRRRRRATRAGGVLLALTLGAGGIQAGVLPYPTWAPAVAIAAAPSALDTGVVRGSLASDAAFLESLRGAVADRTSSAESEGTWRVPSPDDVHVLYASDVGSWRVALVEARMRAGLLEGRQQLWFAGPRGATAGQLENQSGNQPRDHATAWFERPGDDLGWLVVVGAPKVSYLVTASPPEYAADGQVSRAVDTLATGPDGLLERQVAVGLASVVLITPDAAPREWDYVRTSQDEGRDAPDTPRTAVDGSAVPPAASDQLRWAFSELTSASGLPRAPRSVLWTGKLQGWSAVAVAVTAPSGARLLRVELSAPRADEPGTSTLRGVATVRPAGPLTEVGLAWQMSDPADRGDDRPVRRLGVLGPVGATSARLVDGTTRLAEVQLTDRAGLLPPPGAGHEKARVQFTNAAGRVLATVDVLGLHSDLPTGLPQ